MYLTEEHPLSKRRACASVGLSRSAFYRPLVDWRARDAEIIEALTTLAEAKPGLGFWKLYDRLRRAGHRWNHKRVRRIYRELRLHQRSRRKKRVPTREPQPLAAPAAPNQVWSADFMSDALYRGPRFRTFNVLDDFNREILATEIDTSLTSHRLVRVFEQLQAERGLPKMLRTDNGPEFLGAEFTEWCEDHGIVIDYIEPGKPNQNAYIERFNRTFRHEVLNAYVFESLRQVRQITRDWIHEYNEERPHDSLGKIPPAMFRRQTEAARNSTFELCH